MAYEKKNISTFIVAEWQEDVPTIAQVYGVPVNRVYAHIAQESHGNQYWIRNDQKGKSFYAKTLADALEQIARWKNEGYDPNKFSYGLMQLVPAYGLKEYNIRYGKGLTYEDVLRYPSLNIEAGVGYLRILLDRYKDLDTASMRYNGSPTNPKVQQYLQLIKEWENIFNNL